MQASAPAQSAHQVNSLGNSLGAREISSSGRPRVCVCVCVGGGGGGLFQELGEAEGSPTSYSGLRPALTIHQKPTWAYSCCDGCPQQLDAIPRALTAAKGSLKIAQLKRKSRPLQGTKGRSMIMHKALFICSTASELARSIPCMAGWKMYPLQFVLLL